MVHENAFKYAKCCKTRFFACLLFREPDKFAKITGCENLNTVAFQCSRKQKRQNYGVQNKLTQTPKLRVLQYPSNCCWIHSFENFTQVLGSTRVYDRYSNTVQYKSDGYWNGNTGTHYEHKCWKTKTLCPQYSMTRSAAAVNARLFVIRLFSWCSAAN